MIVSIDLDEVIPKMINLCVEICGHGISHVEAVKVAELLEDSIIEQKEGRWLFTDYGGISYYQCSCCDYTFERPLTYTRDDVNKYRKYCAHCGARMFRESPVYE